MSSFFKALEMRARAHAPRSLKKLARLARAAGFRDYRQPGLPHELVSDCRMCGDRRVLIEQLPKGGVVIELGTYRGEFAREILARNAPARLHVADIDYSQFDKSILDDPRVVQHTGLTHEILATFPNESFDWIYVDADHSYEGALRDARASSAKLKPGGYLVFNDFAIIDPHLGHYGVHRAVLQFINEVRWPMAYFALEPYALYDVAFRKPQ